jgi:predicted nucleic acid-binding protein
VRAVLDTSMFIGAEQRRGVDVLPDDLELAVSVITIAELRLGVLVAADLDQRATRLQTLTDALILDVLPIDAPTADQFAALAARLRAAGARAPIHDTWIAATALRHDAAVATQDSDFERFTECGLTLVPRGSGSSSRP